MIEKMFAVKEMILNSLRNEKGAVAFEYVLIIGGVSARTTAVEPRSGPHLRRGRNPCHNGGSHDKPTQGSDRHLQRGDHQPQDRAPKDTGG